jgi:SMC interacting uncharacterized protein involved in chromosome segregation
MTMANDPLDDTLTQLTAIVGQLVRQNQTLISYIDRSVTAIGDMSKDVRVGLRNVNDRIDALRAEMNEKIDALRSEMNERFRAVGARFDEIEERIIRIENGLKQVHHDILPGERPSQRAAIRPPGAHPDRPDQGRRRQRRMTACFPPR